MEKNKFLEECWPVGMSILGICMEDVETLALFTCPHKARVCDQC